MNDANRGRPLRIVYFGTPEYAVPALETLAADRQFAVELVVTRPDRAAGRGRQSSSSPVKQAGERLNLPVYQPESLREPAARLPLERARPDLFVAAAFGLIFGARTLAIPRLGSLNLHASLLPSYRGANPIAAAILAGESITGVSLMVMETGLDTGPVIAAASTAIAADDTTESLTARLAGLGAHLAATAIPRFADGAVTAEAQRVDQATVTRPMIKEDGWIDWSGSALTIERQVRAMWPWPRAWTTIEGDPLQIHSASLIEEQMPGEPGTVERINKSVVVHCGNGAIGLDVVQASGGKPIPGLAWYNGARLAPDQRLGLIGRPAALAPLVSPVD